MAVAASEDEGIEWRTARILGFVTWRRSLVFPGFVVNMKFWPLSSISSCFLGMEITWIRKIQSLSKCIGMPHFCGTKKPGQPYGDPSYDLRTQKSRIVLEELKHQNRISITKVQISI